VEPQLLKLFALHVPVIELVLKGSAIYLLLFTLFRFVLRCCSTASCSGCV